MQKLRSRYRSRNNWLIGGYSILLTTLIALALLKFGLDYKLELTLILIPCISYLLFTLLYSSSVRSNLFWNGRIGSLIIGILYGVFLISSLSVQLLPSRIAGHPFKVGYIIPIILLLSFLVYLVRRSKLAVTVFTTIILLLVVIILLLSLIAAGVFLVVNIVTKLFNLVSYLPREVYFYTAFIILTFLAVYLIVSIFTMLNTIRYYRHQRNAMRLFCLNILLDVSSRNSILLIGQLIELVSDPSTSFDAYEQFFAQERIDSFDFKESEISDMTSLIFVMLANPNLKIRSMAIELLDTKELSFMALPLGFLLFDTSNTIQNYAIRLMMNRKLDAITIDSAIYVYLVASGSPYWRIFRNLELSALTNIFELQHEQAEINIALLSHALHSRRLRLRTAAVQILSSLPKKSAATVPLMIQALPYRYRPVLSYFASSVCRLPVLICSQVIFVVPTGILARLMTQPYAKTTISTVDKIRHVLDWRMFVIYILTIILINIYLSHYQRREAQIKISLAKAIAESAVAKAEAFSTLRKLLKKSDRPLRIAVIKLMTELGYHDQTTTAYLLSSLKSINIAERRAAIEGLTQIFTST